MIRFDCATLRLGSQSCSCRYSTGSVSHWFLHKSVSSFACNVSEIDRIRASSVVSASRPTCVETNGSRSPYYTDSRIGNLSQSSALRTEAQAREELIDNIIDSELRLVLERAADWFISLAQGSI